MQSIMWITTIVLLLGNLGLLAFVLKRLAAKDKTQGELLGLSEIVANLERALGEEVPKLEKAIKDEVRASQATTANTLTVQLQGTADTLVGVVGKLGEAQSQHLEGVIKSIETTVNTLVKTVGELGETQTQELANVSNAVNNLTRTNESRIENVRNTLNDGLQALQTSNANKLEQIRQSVNAQLQTTIDTLTSTVGELGKAQTRQLDTVKNSVNSTADTLVNTVGELGQTQTRQLETVTNAINELTQTNETRIENVRNALTEGLQTLQTSNEDKLEGIRQSVNEQLQTTSDTLFTTVSELGKTQKAQLDSGTEAINNLTQANETRIANVQNTLTEALQALQASNENKLNQIRQSVNEQLSTAVDTLVTTVGELGKTQKAQLDSGTEAINNLTEANKTGIEAVRNTLTEGLQALQTSNENKLEQMRQTVDEQLQSTLAKRIGESFNLVSKRLEEVHRGLGEMQNLATGVGDLKKVLTNVRARGTWGEVRLRALLEQVLTPEQYDTNVRIKEHSREVVEFAIRLPGSDNQPDSCLWLPIDSKFPVADYQRLTEASDAETERAVTREFIRSIEAEAKKIRDKYIAPPKTTDFAIMFLPTEGLYAEVLRQPGQVEELQTKYRIVVAGPTTLTAILSGLRMGFRTLAIQKRSSEVWKLLAAVKTEFGKFTDVLEKLKTQLNRAYNTIDVDTGRRVRAINNKLQAVEELPLERAAAEFGIPNEGQIDKDDADESER